jgi:serine/threonine-protein kinase HipA
LWQEYYGPLQKRVDELRVEGDKWPELHQAIAETEEEISMFTRFGESYGYVFYILQKPPGAVCAFGESR